ncbi:hypothetical protein XENORESO_005461 [Xenotaenia resolanae]|uniref:Peptidase S1 domain-containing protein n=1 Tax=Xenotaenia resolanae TaxID=208358 RepID=A0ABV0WSP1_9TELE
MSGDFPAVVTGWKEPIQVSGFQGPLTVNQLQFSTLPKCRETYPNLMTNKMGCTTARANADCNMGSGSPLLTLYRDVLFLTGVVSQPDGADCTKRVHLPKSDAPPQLAADTHGFTLEW